MGTKFIRCSSTIGTSKLPMFEGEGKTTASQSLEPKVRQTAQGLRRQYLPGNGIRIQEQRPPIVAEQPRSSRALTRGEENERLQQWGNGEATPPTGEPGSWRTRQHPEAAGGRSLRQTGRKRLRPQRTRKLWAGQQIPTLLAQSAASFLGFYPKREGKHHYFFYIK